jgi:hypothetical protein
MHVEIDVKEVVLILLFFVLLAVAYLFGRYEGAFLVSKMKEMCGSALLNISLK